MSLLINIPDRNIDKLLARLKKELGEESIEVWPNIKNPDHVSMALVWKHESGSLANLPNLKGISSFGAGVDNILEDAQLPDVAVARIVDNDLATVWLIL